METGQKEGGFLRNKIIVPIDFKEQSLRVLKRSYYFAKLFDAELLLLHVVDKSNMLKSFFSTDDYQNNNLLKKKLKDIENDLNNTFNNSNVLVRSLIVEGKLYEQIINKATENKAIFVVMGENDLPCEKEREFEGSNTFNVIKDAPCPVISVKNNKSHGELNDIVLPLDFAGPINNQIQRAVEIGGYFGSTINIVSVLSKNNKMNKLIQKTKANQVKKIMANNGLHSTYKIIQSNDELIYKTLIDYSVNINANLIMIMTQQKKHIVSSFIGSTAGKVICESEIPVLSINPFVKFQPGIVTSFKDSMDLIQKQARQTGLNNFRDAV